MAALPTPVLVPNQKPLALSVIQLPNDKGDNEMIVRLCSDLLAFTLQLRKTRKSLARGPSMKAVRLVIASNGGPYLQMRSVGSYRTSGTKKERTRVRRVAC